MQRICLAKDAFENKTFVTFACEKQKLLKMEEKNQTFETCTCEK